MSTSNIVRFVDSVWEELCLYVDCPEEGPGKVETAWCHLLRNCSEKDLRKAGSSIAELSDKFETWHSEPSEELEDWAVKLFESIRQQTAGDVTS